MKKIMLLLLFIIITTIPTQAAQLKISDPSEQPLTSFRYVTEFGAVGDGKTDDTAAIKRAIQSGCRLRFPEGKYKITEPLQITDGILSGKGELIFSGYTENECALRLYGTSVISGLTLTGNDSGTILRLIQNRNSRLYGLTIQTSDGSQTNMTPLDFFGGNCNIVVDHCTIAAKSSRSGGTWVREVKPDGISENIILRNCNFIHQTRDEALAVWGWFGTVRNIQIIGCSFSDTSSTHLITLGQQGVTENVRLADCRITSASADSNTSSIVKIAADPNAETSIIKDILLDRCRITNLSGEKQNGIFFSSVPFFVKNCRIHSNNEVQLSYGSHAHFNSCLITSDTQMRIHQGNYENCRFEFNPDARLTTSYCMLSGTLSNCVLCGVNGRYFVHDLYENTKIVFTDVVFENSRLDYTIYSDLATSVTLNNCTLCAPLYTPHASGTVRETVFPSSAGKNVLGKITVN